MADFNGRPYGSPNREAAWRQAVAKLPVWHFVIGLRLKHCEMGIVAFDDEFKQNHREAHGNLPLFLQPERQASEHSSTENSRL